MKTKLNFTARITHPWSLVTLLLLSTLNSQLATCFAQGTAFTYQGRLNSGSGLATGSFDVTFTLFATNVTGIAITGPVTNAATGVTNGLFTTTVDFGPGVFLGANRWLELAVRTNGAANFTALAPRQALTAVPYAVMAGSASNLLGALPASQLTGTIPAAAVNGTYNGAVTFNNGANIFDGSFFGQFFGSSFTGGFFTGQFLGDGSGLANLNASQLSSGTVSSARLAGNVALLNSNQTFIGQNVFAQGIGIGRSNSIFAVDAQANQAVLRLTSTNAVFGSVLVLQNQSTNVSQYAGAINFNDAAANTPGQIAYLKPNATNFNTDVMVFRVGYAAGLSLVADSRGVGVPSLIGGFSGNQISTLGSGGNVIAGGGYPGIPNTISSNSSGVFIGAGSLNQVGPDAGDSVIGGGFRNTIFSGNALIGGGYGNVIQPDSPYATISGGVLNSIETNALGATIAGGDRNTNGLGAYRSFIGGGIFNAIFSGYSVIGGGDQNFIRDNANYSVIGGGSLNVISNAAVGVFIGGGVGNKVMTNANYAVIGGGIFGVVSGVAGVIGGGGINRATNNNIFQQPNRVGGLSAVVPGGAGNTANGDFSFAAGRRAQALHDGAFVLADSQDTPFSSTTTNQFSVRANGGVRLETAGAGVTVDGQAIFSGTDGSALNNVNAATLNGSPASAFAPASGSTNYIQNQSASPQSASLYINGTARVAGLLRSGSETGTSQLPSPAGLIVRRINPTTPATNFIIALARTQGNVTNIVLVRDGTAAGFQIQYPTNTGPLTIACMGMDNTGAQKNFYTNFTTFNAGTVQIYSNAQNIVHFQCTFGNTYDAGQHLTQVTLSRYYTDSFWSGTLISTFNQ